MLQGSAGILEREAEAERIARVVDRAVEGAGSIVLVEGEPGIGKTALLEVARELGSDRGLGVLSARATELEHDYPYGLVRQLLDPVLRGLGRRRRDRMLDGVGPAAALWPSLAGEQAGPTSEFAILNGLWWLFANLAEERPVVATVDDLHWADQASRRFLAFLAPRVRELPLAMLVAARNGEPEGTAPLTRAASDLPLRPAPLSRAACAALAHEKFGRSVDDEFSIACHRATGGNPFYLQALLDELAREGVQPVAAMAERVLGLRPRTVANAITARLATLSAEAAALARALAILGDDAASEQLEALADVLPGRALAVAADQLATAGIVAPGVQMRFTHPIVAGAIEADLGAAERDRLHRQAAALLQRLGAPPEQTAAHVLACRPAGNPEAVGVLTSAAREALRRGATDFAVSYLRRALVEPPALSDRAALLTELGLAEQRLEGDSAIEHLRQAHELADTGTRVIAGTILAGALLSANRPKEAAGTASEVLERLAVEGGEARRHLQATLLLAAQLDQSLVRERDQVRSQVRGLEWEEGFGARLLEAAVALDDARQLLVSASELSTRVQRTLEDRSLLSGEGFVVLGTVLPILASTDSDVALSWLERGLGRARERGDVLALGVLQLTSCLVRTARGGLPEALLDGEQGLELAAAWGMDAGLTWGRACLAMAKLETGDVDAADDLLAGAAPQEAELPNDANSLVLLHGRALVHLARGRPSACLKDAAELGRHAEALGWRNPAFTPWRSLMAICMAALGERPESAIELADEELELARRWGAPSPLGAALRARAWVETHTREKYLREAVGILEDSPARLQHAHALVELGALLRRERRLIQARSPLRAGLDLARECGATPLAERAYRELRATGASPRKLTRTGVDTLTAAEHRVAHMAASGKTNKQIAQELYVTLKTVESHLAQTYRKLDITTRAQLTNKLEPNRARQSG